MFTMDISSWQVHDQPFYLADGTVVVDRMDAVAYCSSTSKSKEELS